MGGDGADVSRGGAQATGQGAQTGVPNCPHQGGLQGHSENGRSRDKARQLSPGLESQPNSFLLPELGGKLAAARDSLPTDHHPRSPHSHWMGKLPEWRGRPAWRPGLGPATSHDPHLRPVTRPCWVPACCLTHQGLHEAARGP